MRFERRVLLTREEGDIEKDAKIFLNRNIGVVRLPLIKTIPLPYNLPPMEPDYVIFQSRNAFKYFAFHLKKFPKAKVVAVGEKTERFIKERGFDVFITPDNQSAEGLCEVMLKQERGVVWVPRSAIGKKEVLECLSKENFDVFPIDVYTTVNIYYRSDIFKCRVSKANAIIFASPSAVNGFLENLRIFNNIKILSELMIVAIGKTTKKSLEKKNLKVDYVPEKPSIEAIADYLAQFWHVS